MSLWKDYVDECGILEIIEEPWGFATFHLQEGAVHINDMYVSPPVRKSGGARQLLGQVEDFGRDHGCTEVRAFVHKHSEVFEGSLKASLAVGFTVRDENETYILIAKPIEGE